MLGLGRVAPRGLGIWSLPFAALMLTACPNPQATFDDFNKRYEKTMGGSTSSATTGAGGAAACTPPAVGMADGTYLFALSAKISPKKALAFKADLTTAKAATGGLQFSMNVTPLSAMDQMTPVGAPFMVGPFDVGADGKFDAAIGTLMISGMANAITGSDITADSVVLHGELCSQTPNFICGTVDGNVTMPIMASLAGSTFSMQKAMNGMLPAPVLDCAMTPAKYH